MKRHTIKYRIFHAVEVEPGVRSTRPYDTRNRTFEAARRIAETLDLGYVTKAGSFKPVWHPLSA